MKVYTLDIDSGERDPTVHPTSNNFIVDLATPIYNVNKLEVVSARVPASVPLIHAHNNKFSVTDDVDTYTVTLSPSADYSSGGSIATHLETQLAASGCDTVDTVAYTGGKFVFSNAAGTDAFTFDFHSGVDGWTSNTLTRTTPNQILGFSAADQASTSAGVLTGGTPDFTHAPKTFVLRVTSGSDKINQEAFTNTPFYTGVFMNNNASGADSYLTFSGTDDAVMHDEHKKEIRQLQLEFLYKENNKLIPVDFGGRDYAIKFQIHGSKDKLENLPKITEEEVSSLELPPPVHIPELVVRENLNKWEQWIPIAVIIIIGVVLIRALSVQSRRSALPAS